MQTNRFRYANLDGAGLEKVKTLEEQMEAVVLVMERHLPAAKLTDEQVEQLKAVEADLGVILVAYQR